MGGGRLAVGDLVADRYEVVREIGKGAMGQVFLAKDTKFKQEVALKVAVRHVGSNEQLFRTRFEREARIGHELGKTTGFVRALDWGETEDGRLYLAMDHVASAGPLDLKSGSTTTRLQRLLQAARLVAECHRQGIVHRDIKPTNFLVTAAGEVYLTDFGLAKTKDEADLPDALADGAATQTGVAVGTPVYMPPEQFSDAKSVDAKADVYALGVMLFRVLAGRPPFKTPISNLMLEQEEVRQGKARAPNPKHFGSEASTVLNDLAAKAVAIDPWKRPTAAALVETLEQEVRYAPTVVDRNDQTKRRPRARSNRNLVVDVDRRASSRRVRVDEAVRSYTPPPSRWERWVKRLGKLTIAIVLLGVPALLSAVVLADLGGVQSRLLPAAWRNDVGQLTVGLYGRMPDDSLARIDMTAPKIALPRAASDGADWTDQPTLTLKVEVRDASLRTLTVGGVEQPLPEPRRWRSSFEVDVPLPKLGEHTIRIEARDAADAKGRHKHVVWRVDPERFLVNVRLQRSEKGVFVIGRLEPPLAIPLQVGEHAIRSNPDGTIRKLIAVGEADRLPLRATSCRGDEVVQWLAVPPVGGD